MLQLLHEHGMQAGLRLVLTYVLISYFIIDKIEKYKIKYICNAKYHEQHVLKPVDITESRRSHWLNITR